MKEIFIRRVLVSSFVLAIHFLSASNLFAAAMNTLEPDVRVAPHYDFRPQFSRCQDDFLPILTLVPVICISSTSVAVELDVTQVLGDEIDFSSVSESCRLVGSEDRVSCSISTVSTESEGQRVAHVSAMGMPTGFAERSWTAELQSMDGTSWCLGPIQFAIDGSSPCGVLVTNSAGRPGGSPVLQTFVDTTTNVESTEKRACGAVTTVHSNSLQLFLWAIALILSLGLLTFQKRRFIR